MLQPTQENSEKNLEIKIKNQGYHEVPISSPLSNREICLIKFVEADIQTAEFVNQPNLKLPHIPLEFVSKSDAHKPTLVRSKCFLILQIINICLGSLEFGYNLSAFNTVSGVVRYLNRWKNESDFVLYNGLITSAFPLGGVLSPFLIPLLMRRYKRAVRKLSIYFDLFTIMAGVIQIVTENPVNIILGRFLIGISVSMSTTTIPTYIREFSPQEMSGRLGSLNQLGVSFGVCVALSFGFLLPTFKQIEKSNDYDDPISWRIALGFPIATSILRAFLLKFVFTDQIKQGLKQEVFENQLLRFSRTQISDKDWISLMDNINAASEKKSDDKKQIVEGEPNQFFDPFQITYRRRWFLAVIMAFGTQASGITAFLFFSNTIYKTYDPENASKYSIIMSLVSLFYNAIFTFTVNLAGRRQFIIFGMSINIITLFLFMIFNALGNFTLIFASIILYFFGFQIALGPIPWFYVAEIMDDRGVAQFALSRWISTFAVGLLTPYMIFYLNPGGTFGTYGALLCTVFIYFLFEFKETKNLTQYEVALQFCSQKQVPDIDKRQKDKLAIEDIQTIIKLYQKT